jgi:hypothetical protein
MGRIDGTSRDNGRPAGVTDSFQVSTHSVEPVLSNRCRNLLSHDDIGPAGTDKAEELRPEVAFVGGTAALPCDAEGLAWARTGPERAVIGPAGETGREAPAADAGEEVALRVAGQISGRDIRDRSGINVRGRKVPGVNEIAEPLCCIRVDLVEIDHTTVVAEWDTSRQRIQPLW